MLTPETNSLTCWPKRVSHVMSESSSSFVQHYEFLDVLLQPFQQFSFWSDHKEERHVKEKARSDFQKRFTDDKTKANWFQRRRDQWIWCCTTPLSARKKFREIWETQSIRGMSMKNEAVIPAPGNRCGLTHAKIQSNILNWGDRQTLNMQTLGNMETGRDESSNSTGSGKPCRAVNTKTIPSPNNPRRTSCVLTSRGKSRFVDDLHIPNVEHHRTSAELLSERENADESEPCLAHSKTSIQETVAASVASHPSTRKLDADSISVSCSTVYMYTNITFLRRKGSGTLFLPIHRTG